MKKIFIGIIIGVMLMLAGQVYGAEVASHVGKKITNEYAITVDGKDLGVKAIVVDGISYTPNRAIIGAMGGDVKFLNKTVVVTTDQKSGGGAVETQSPPTTKPVTAEMLRENIKGIEGGLDLLRMHVEQAEKTLATYPDGPDKVRLQESITKQKQQIAEYEARKADLEAQLAELESQQ